MRRLPLLVVLLVLTACRGAQPYTREDLIQVRRAYATIPSIYVHFKQVYYANNAAGIHDWFGREQQACHLVDKVDKRDTIDPNTNLFEASVGLDNMCNDIESAYAGWAQEHGLPYDKSVVLGRPLDVFVDGDKTALLMPHQMQHPAAFG